jgi:hypothetical protein
MRTSSMRNDWPLHESFESMFNRNTQLAVRHLHQEASINDAATIHVGGVTKKSYSQPIKKYT